MKFSRSNKEPKKSPEEEYTEQISALTESELRDLHKDLKIDHYGNSTAAMINTASGVGLFSLRSTTRRYRTECWQIEAMEARMKDMGWTPHPNRYRDAVPIALGVAAGTTAGMSFGLINVEKNAKRTKDYVKKKDLFKTKELAEIEDVDAETEEAERVEEVQDAEPSVECIQAPEKAPQHVDLKHSISRKPVPAPAATNTEAVNTQLEDLVTVVETTTITEDISAVPAEPISTQPHAASVDICLATELKTTKKETLFSQVSVMNKKMRNFNFKKAKEEETTVTITEIDCETQSPGVNADAVISHGVVERPDNPPMYTSEAKECAA